jgi:hypothetical protein
MAGCDCGFESRRVQECVSLVNVECFVCYLSLRGVNHPSREVLPNVACLCVILKHQKWGGLGPLGLSSNNIFLEYLTQKYYSFIPSKSYKELSKEETRWVREIKNGRIVKFPKIMLWLCDRIFCLPDINDSERNNCADVRSLIPKLILP